MDPDFNPVGREYLTNHDQRRGTLADESLDAAEEDPRREIAREWAYLQRRSKIVGFAIREWDFLAPTESAEASS